VRSLSLAVESGIKMGMRSAGPGIVLVTLLFQPMPLQRREAFDHPDWLFELKYDGFRALLVIQAGRMQLFSINATNRKNVLLVSISFAV